MENEPKTGVLTIRLSLALQDKLRRLAHDKQMSVSELVRRCIEVTIYCENLLEKRDLTSLQSSVSLFEHV